MTDNNHYLRDKFNNYKDYIGIIGENSLKLVKSGDYIKNFKFKD